MFMFNFVVNKAIQVFTLRFALDSARNENSEGSKILHHQNIFCFSTLLIPFYTKAFIIQFSLSIRTKVSLSDLLILFFQLKKED